MKTSAPTATQTGERAHISDYNAPWEWDAGRPEHYDLTWLTDSTSARILTLYGGNEPNKKAIPSRRIRKLIASAPETAVERDKLREQLQELLKASKVIRNKYWANYGTDSEFTICIGSFHGKAIPEYWRKFDTAIKHAEECK